MKHILFITFVLSICFCSCNKNKSTTRLKELEVTNIDKSFLNIIKEYETAYPNDSNIVVFFNLESDLSTYYGNGIYFTIENLAFHILKLTICSKISSYHPFTFF